MKLRKKMVKDFGLDIKVGNRSKYKKTHQSRDTLKSEKPKSCDDQRKTGAVVETCNRRANQISEMDSVLERVLQTRTR